MRDRPSGLELLELGRSLLLDELLPLVPADRRRDVHLLATAIGIALREVDAGDGPAQAIQSELAALYEAHEAGGVDGPPDGLLRRFAADLRNGAFETSQGHERAARAILWRLAVLRLHEGNPQFLAAHGLGD